MNEYFLILFRMPLIGKPIILIVQLNGLNKNNMTKFTIFGRCGWSIVGLFRVGRGCSIKFRVDSNMESFGHLG